MITEELYTLFQKHPLISTDTRKIIPGSIFFALKGHNFDGNKFAVESLKLGAEYAVVDNSEFAKNENIILVQNVLETLQQLAKYHRKKLGLPIIAITGTNGKTTTKELIAAILSKKYDVSFTEGNLNNHIGVPLTILKMSGITEIGIVEMGANHAGEIKTLCEIADPDYGMITNIGKAHLEGFGSFDNIKNTKAELYRYIENKKGKIFINSDNEILNSISGTSMTQIAFGSSDDIFLKGEIVNQTPHLNIRAWFPKGVLYLKSKLIGSYNFENILAAACIGQYFKVDPIQIENAIKNYSPSNNRSQLITKGSNTIIMDAYNANPTSMHASIINFITLPGKSKCLILGDMLELGNVSEKEHQNIIDLILKYSFKQVFVVGNIFSGTKIKDPVKAFETTNDLINHLREHPINKSITLIKGSRGLMLEKVLPAFN